MQFSVISVKNQHCIQAYSFRRKMFWNGVVPTYLLTYSTEQSPSWEANRFSSSQEFPRILWNPKTHYRIHKCPPPVPSLSQLDPVHTPTSCLLKINLTITLPSIPGSPKWSLTLTFSHQNPVYTTRLSSKEIFSPSNKIRREIGRAKDLTAPLYLLTYYMEQSPS